MNWISIEQDVPKSDWHVVFVTDGVLTLFARWINDPKSYYGEDLTEWDEELQDEIPLDKEWHEPHWKFETCIGPFYGNDECFGHIDIITHWMPLPTPPESA